MVLLSNKDVSDFLLFQDDLSITNGNGNGHLQWIYCHHSFNYSS